MAGFPLAELRALTDEELIRLHDEEQKQLGSVGVNYYLQELARRDQVRQTETMLDYTKTIRTLTVVITFLTLVNVGVVVLAGLMA